MATTVVGGVIVTAPATASASLPKQLGYGWDTCANPTTSQMQTMWNNSKYMYYGVYIGGGDLGCPPSHVNASWTSTVLGQGWNLLPIWVGKQNPCAQDESDHFSLDTSTAEQQGSNEAASALSAWEALRNDSNVEIEADLEFDRNENDTAACRTAQRYYVEGWDNYLRIAPKQISGVYMSSSANHMDDLSTNAHPPNFIDGADWDGNPHTSVLLGVPSGHWAHQQRDKQYDDNVLVMGMHIDERCTNTWDYETSGASYNNTACS